MLGRGSSKVGFIVYSCVRPVLKLHPTALTVPTSCSKAWSRCSKSHVQPVFLSPSRHMDIDAVTTFLAASPVPLLATAFTICKFIYATFQAIQQVRQTKAENGEYYIDDLDNLMTCIAQLLYTLNEGFRDGKLSEGKTAAPLRSLQA